MDDRSRSGTKKITRPFETDEIKRPNIRLLTSVVETAKDPEFNNEVDSRVEVNDFIKLKVTIENRGDGPAKNLVVEFLQSKYYQRFRPSFSYNNSSYNVDLLNARESKDLILVYRVKQTDDFAQIAKADGIEFRALVKEDLNGQNYVSDNFEVYSPELELGEAVTGTITEAEEKYRDEEFMTEMIKSLKL